MYKPHSKTSFVHRTVRRRGIGRRTVWTSIQLVRCFPGWSDLSSARIALMLKRNLLPGHRHRVGLPMHRMVHARMRVIVHG